MIFVLNVLCLSSYLVCVECYIDIFMLKGSVVHSGLGHSRADLRKGSISNLKKKYIKKDNSWTLYIVTTLSLGDVLPEHQYCRIYRSYGGWHPATCPATGRADSVRYSAPSAS